jgi:hypothetical protein
MTAPADHKALAEPRWPPRIERERLARLCESTAESYDSKARRAAKPGPDGSPGIRRHAETKAADFRDIAAALRAAPAQSLPAGVGREALEKEEISHAYTIDQRDLAEKAADNLADLIAQMTGGEVGEHSNMNDPWERADELATEFLRQQQQPPPPEPAATPSEGVLRQISELQMPTRATAMSTAREAIRLARAALQEPTHER